MMHRDIIVAAALLIADLRAWREVNVTAQYELRTLEGGGA